MRGCWMVGLACGMGWLCVAAVAVAPVNANETEELFVRRIAPLMQEKCLACHGSDPAKVEGELDLRTRAGLLRGGESGQATLVAGKPEASPLFLAIQRNDADWSAMPPKEADKLTAEQAGWIKTWIAGGAPWPNAERSLEILKA